MTLRLVVLAARVLLGPAVLLASLAVARVVAAPPALLLGLGYAACLIACAAWPRRSLRRVALPLGGWLLVCWALGFHHGSGGVQLGATMAGLLACALPRAMRDFQRRARGREHMDLGQLRVARRRAAGATRAIIPSGGREAA